MGSAVAQIALRTEPIHFQKKDGNDHVYETAALDIQNFKNSENTEKQSVKILFKKKIKKSFFKIEYV